MFGVRSGNEVKVGVETSPGDPRVPVSTAVGSRKGLQPLQPFGPSLSSQNAVVGSNSLT